MTFQVTPTRKLAVDPKALQAFAAGAEAPPEPIRAGQGAATPVATEPVDFSTLDNKRRHPVFALRLTDREAAQLKQLADTSPNSAHAICLAAVQKVLAEHFPE